MTGAPSQLSWESPTPQYLFSEARHLFFLPRKGSMKFLGLLFCIITKDLDVLQQNEARSPSVQSVDSYLTHPFSIRLLTLHHMS